MGRELRPHTAAADRLRQSRYAIALTGAGISVQLHHVEKLPPVKAPSGAEVLPLKEVLHANRRHTVCEEAGRPSLAELKTAHPHIPTKSGLVAGMGERNDEVVAAIRNRRAHGCDLLTIGQYLQPAGARLAIERCVYPDESARTGQELGFRHVASGPLVHSSCHYHAEHQARSL